MRVVVGCLVVSAALSAQGPRISLLSRSEQAPLVRLLDEAARRRRAPDRWAHWDGHFLQGPEGQTYVPYTVRLEAVGGSFKSLAVGVRVVGWNYVYSDGFAVPAESEGDDRVFRGALLLKPGRCTVFVAVQERDADSPRSALAERVIVVPGFDRGLKISSVLVVDRVEELPDDLSPKERAAYPYALARLNLVPVHRADFSRRDTLTVAFQVYNAGMFEDGRPDVEVQYRVFRKGDSRRALGATTPQVFNQETLPEEFSLKEGHQLTAVQSLPLDQFEPGEYRLEIDVQDYLARARTSSEVPFTILR